MAKIRPIPTPLGQHWRRIRYQFLPILVFVGASAVSVWLWDQQKGMPVAVGEAEVLRTDLSAPANGKLVHLTRDWQTFEKVSKGQIVARLDDEECLAALLVVRAEIEQVRKQLLATDAKTRMDLGAAARSIGNAEQQPVLELRRLATDIEKLRLDLLDRQTLIDTDKIELQRQTERLEAVKKLVAEGSETPYTLWDVQMRVDVIKQRLAGNDKTLAFAKTQLQSALDRQADLRKMLDRNPVTTQPSDVEVFLAPIRAAIAVQEARKKELDLRLESLTVKAPFNGMIRDIFCFPGQTVTLGTPIMTILANEAPHVITYLREYHRAEPKVGAVVDMRVRSLPIRSVAGVVSEIGPQVVKVPPQQLRDPTKPEWGLPIRIDMAPESGLHPGELVDVTFRHVAREP
jgi:multidrug resistance efflux pump